jgi:hypothetical protein
MYSFQTIALLFKKDNVSKHESTKYKDKNTHTHTHTKEKKLLFGKGVVFRYYVRIGFFFISSSCHFHS